MPVKGGWSRAGGLLAGRFLPAEKLNGEAAAAGRMRRRRGRTRLQQPWRASL